MGLSSSKHFLKGEAVDTGHPHIGHGTVDLIKAGIVEELVRRRKRSHFHPGGFDRSRQRTAYRLIVIDYGNFHGVLPSSTPIIPRADHAGQRARQTPSP